MGRDLPRGRLHLPLEDLRHFGILPEGVRTAPASAHLLGASSKAWRDLLRFHQAQGRIATVTAVRPPARFGGLIFDGDLLANFT